MKRKIRNFSILAILLSLAVVVTGCVEVMFIDGGGIEYKEYDELFFDPVKRFTLDNFNGQVVVLPAEDDKITVQYVKILRGKSEEYLAQAADLVLIETQEGSDYVEIQSKQPYPRPLRSQLYSMRVDFRIYVPRETVLNLRSRNGQINVSGMRESLTLKTSNGGIEIADHYGTMYANTSNGTITVSESEGRMNLDTSNGKIRLEGVKGRVDGESSNGGIYVDRKSVILGADLDTSNGRIEFEGEMIEGYNYDLETSNSRIHLWIDKTVGYDLYAKTSNGRIEFNFPYTFAGAREKNYMRGQLFGGGIELELETSNGDIVFFDREG